MLGIPDGIEGPLTIVPAFRAALPDIHLANERLIGEGDVAVQELDTLSMVQQLGVMPG
jgi:hypothetical protein